MISLAEVAGALRCKFHGNGDLLFSSLSEPETAREDQLVLAIDTKYMEQLDTTKAKAAIVGEDLDWLAKGFEGIIIAKNSKLVLAKVTNAPLAGLEANAPVNVSVALLFVSSKDTPPDAIVYVPVTPAIVNVSPASGVLWIAAITNVVPV